MNYPVTLMYISLQNRQGAGKLLQEAGFPKPPKTPEQMVKMLMDYIKMGGKDAEAKVRAIHPDVAWFSANGALPWLNCGGCESKLSCLGADGIPGQPALYNADAGNPAPPKGLSDKTINTLIIAGASVFAVALLTLVVVNVKK